MQEKEHIIQSKQEIKKLYKHFPEIRALLRKYGCKKSIAEDIFQEAMIVYLRKKGDKDFKFQLEPIHYIKQTCKYLWLNEARKKQKQLEAIQSIKIEDISTNVIDKELQFKKMEEVLSQIGKKCQELLQLFYGLGWTMVQIAKKLDLRNDKVAKAMKYRCLKKAKDLVKNVQINVEPLK